MKQKIGIIISIVIAVLAIAFLIFSGVKGGVQPAVDSIKGIFSSENKDGNGKYSENNDSLTTETLKDITYDRYVLWANNVEDGEGIYYLTDGQSTTLTVYTEEVGEDALETMEGKDALSYEEVYNILADNIESGYGNVEEVSREMTTVGDGEVEAMTLKFFTNRNSEEENATPYDHWTTFFLYKGNLYYFVLAEPQEVAEDTEIKYNVVTTSIICQ